MLDLLAARNSDTQHVLLRCPCPPLSPRPPPTLKGAHLCTVSGRGGDRVGPIRARETAQGLARARVRGACDVAPESCAARSARQRPRARCVRAAPTLDAQCAIAGRKPWRAAQHRAVDALGNRRGTGSGGHRVLWAGAASRGIGCRAVRVAWTREAVRRASGRRVGARSADVTR